MFIHKLSPLLFSLALVCFSYQANSQDTPPENWFNLDPITTGGPTGVGTEKAYSELLKDKKSQTVIVAVMDSGLDIYHEDLKGKIWTNSKEIAGNGIDDDHNGYADDVNGWNFLGGRDGAFVERDNLELTRLYRDYHIQFANMDPAKAKGQKGYSRYLELKKKYEDKIGLEKSNLARLTKMKDNYLRAFEMMKSIKGSENFTVADIDKAIKEEGDQNEKGALLKEFKPAWIRGNGSSQAAQAWLEKALTSTRKTLETSLSISFDPRPIVADDYHNADQRNYGNNDVNHTAFHGTMCSGLIAADRNNNKGIKGIADNVLIMPIRVVPDGDERDKDVANGIYYAVDNGAKIINMSFGKEFAFNKEAVDKAVRYAEKKGVLIVHAAGNNGYNLDSIPHYPNPKIGDNPSKRFTNFINVGATSWKGGEDLPATFSNYGKDIVDLFAPGVQIRSTDEGSKYSIANGTSFSCPITAGCAALIWSYYPNLTVAQVKDLLLSTVTKINTVVKVPGGKYRTSFSNLSKTGGVVNVYEALKKAATIK